MVRDEDPGAGDAPLCALDAYLHVHAGPAVERERAVPEFREPLPVPGQNWASSSASGIGTRPKNSVRVRTQSQPCAVAT